MGSASVFGLSVGITMFSFSCAVSGLNSMLSSCFLLFTARGLKEIPVLYVKRNLFLTLCMLGTVNFHALLSSADFSKLSFSKNNFKKLIRASNSFDPGQD